VKTATRAAIAASENAKWPKLICKTFRQCLKNYTYTPATTFLGFSHSCWKFKSIENLHTPTHCCQNLEAAETCFSTWVDKWAVIHLDSEILFSAESSEPSVMKSHGGDLTVCCSKNERKPSEKTVHCVIPTLCYSEKSKTEEVVNRLMVSRG
jgi:hypothetical protein